MSAINSGWYRRSLASFENIWKLHPLYSGYVIIVLPRTRLNSTRSNVSKMAPCFLSQVIRGSSLKSKYTKADLFYIINSRENDIILFDACVRACVSKSVDARFLFRGRFLILNCRHRFPGNRRRGIRSTKNAKALENNDVAVPGIVHDKIAVRTSLW